MNERVLVLEDDRPVRETATLLLERVELRVTAVADGRQALEKVAGHRFPDKLGDDARETRCRTTVRGAGYRLAS